MLDFFGVPVKAQELLNLLAQMKLLAKKLHALESSGQQLPRTFRLEASSIPPQAKWGKAIGWTPRDDAMLLLGVYWHGIGHWDALIGDERLGLADKLASVLAPPPPKAQHAPTPPPEAGGGGEGGAGTPEGAGVEGVLGQGKDKEKESLPKGEGVSNAVSALLVACFTALFSASRNSVCGTCDQEGCQSGCTSHC